MEITYIFDKEKFEYDGSQINASWAFKKYGIKGSSIIVWRGPVNITPDNLKDFADVGLEIKSNEMINCVCEFFDVQPADIRMSYMRQRLLVLMFIEELNKKGIETVRSGDDVYVNGAKLTISIATASVKSMKIHFAFNIQDKGTPDVLKTIGLFDIEDKKGNKIFNENNLEEFVETVINNYIDELKTIEYDISKTDTI